MNPSICRSMLPATLLSLALIAGPAAVARADDRHANGKHAPSASLSHQETAFGQPGNRQKVDRTIAIDMNDMMRFGPSELTVRQGETIRFVIRNKGKILHEMVLGTLEDFKAHGEMMKQHPGMEHEEDYATHVKPGKKEVMLWQFTKTGEFHYACLIPGHFEAGMIGKITVKKG